MLGITIDQNVVQLKHTLLKKLLSFAQKNLSNTDAVRIPSKKNIYIAYGYSYMGYPLLKGKVKTMYFDQWQQAHLYFLAKGK